MEPGELIANSIEEWMIALLGIPGQTNDGQIEKSAVRVDMHPTGPSHGGVLKKPRKRGFEGRPGVPGLPDVRFFGGADTPVRPADTTIRGRGCPRDCFVATAPSASAAADSPGMPRHAIQNAVIASKAKQSNRHELRNTLFGYFFNTP